MYRLQGISGGRDIQSAGVRTSRLPLHLHMQQVVDDAAAIQRAHKLITGRLHAHRRVKGCSALQTPSLQQEHCFRRLYTSPLLKLQSMACIAWVGALATR